VQRYQRENWGGRKKEPEGGRTASELDREEEKGGEGKWFFFPGEILQRGKITGGSALNGSR